MSVVVCCTERVIIELIDVILLVDPICGFLQCTNCNYDPYACMLQYRDRLRNGEDN
jgi:hypothetical protein